MNIHNNINNHYLTCPICQSNGKPQLIRSGSGLFTCPYCQERLVVSQSGHYVRDPFIWKQIVFCELSHRQNRVSSNTLKGSPLLKRPLVSFALVISMLMGMIILTQQKITHDSPAPPKTENLEKPR